MGEPRETVENDEPGLVRIQRAALRLFAERGFDATGIRDITQAARVNVSVVYHHFPSKEAILATLMESGLRRYNRMIEAALRLASLPEERLFALAAVHVMIHVHDRPLATIMDHELGVLQPEWRLRVLELRDTIDAQWNAVLHEGMASDVFDVANAKMARLALIRTCTSVVHWYRSEGPWTVEELAGAIGDLVLGAVRARREGSPIRAFDLSQPSLAVLHANVQSALTEVDWVLPVQDRPARPAVRPRGS
jgi:AcrR family transcriptional regulator